MQNFTIHKFWFKSIILVVFLPLELPFNSSQVLLQTYIEYLRGIVEETKTINHHGKEISVETVDKNPAPLSKIEP